MGNRSRRKGHRFERAVARRFSEALGVDARRGLQARGGDTEAADVEVPGVPVHVECKRGKRTRIKAALAQAVEAAPPDTWPVAITRDDREDALATLRLEDLLELLGEWRRAVARPGRTTPESASGGRRDRGGDRGG